MGRQGVEKRIDVIAMAIQMKATVFDLEEAELCYAPQYGSAKDPVNMAGFVAGQHPPRRRGGRPLGGVEAAGVGRRRAGDAQRPPADGRGRRGDSRHDPHSVGRAAARLDELPRDREIWVHCAVGQTSYNAVRLLQQHGFKVRNLSGGITSYKLEKHG